MICAGHVFCFVPPALFHTFRKTSIDKTTCHTQTIHGYRDWKSCFIHVTCMDGSFHKCMVYKCMELFQLDGLKKA